MNSCIVMAEIVQNPELRYTSDTQTPIAEMWVQFPGLRPEDPPNKLKVVGWGNLAQEIQERFHEGDRVVIEGRLGMNTVDRPEGFKEKRAELTAQKIHHLGANVSLDAPMVSAAAPATTAAPQAQAFREPAPAAKPAASAAPAAAKATAAKKPAAPPPVVAEPDFDDIPF